MLTVAELLRGPRPAGIEHDPIKHLSACHRRVEQRLESLARAGAAFAGRREEALSAIDAALDFFATNGVRHTTDEEESLFPRLLPRLAPEERRVIEELEREHVTADGLHAELDELAHRLHQETTQSAMLEAFVECVARLTAHYERHIAVEDSTVASLARQHLDAGELAGIRAEMQERRRAQ